MLINASSWYLTFSSCFPFWRHHEAFLLSQHYLQTPSGRCFHPRPKVSFQSLHLIHPETDYNPIHILTFHFHCCIWCPPRLTIFPPNPEVPFPSLHLSQSWQKAVCKLKILPKYFLGFVYLFLCMAVSLHYMSVEGAWLSYQEAAEALNLKLQRSVSYYRCWEPNWVLLTIESSV